MYSAWLPYAGAIIFAAFIFIAPGLLIAVTLRQRGIAALGIAPILSASTVAVGSIAAAKLGIRWSIFVPFATALLIAALGWAVMSLAQRFGWADSYRWLGVSEKPVERAQWSSRVSWVTYGAIIIGALLLIRQVVNGIGLPENLSQTYDVNFHVNAIRYIAEEGNASSLTLAAMTGGDEVFYPGVWHAFAALVYMYTGTSVIASANVITLVISALVWPVSLMYLVRIALNLNIVGIVGAGVAAASFSSFPLVLVFYGVLYPNALGLAIIPAAFAMGAQLVRVCATRYLSSTSALYLLFWSSIALALAHPNTLMSWLLFALPLIVIRMVLQCVAMVRREVPVRQGILQLVLLSLYLIVLGILWNIVRPLKHAGPWGPKLSDSQAWGEMLGNASIGVGSILIVISAFTLIGAYTLLVRKDKGRWVVASWLLVGLFFVMARSLAWEEERYFWVGVWYHDHYRLAALLPIFAAPLAAYGVQTGWTYVRTRLTEWKLPAVAVMTVTTLLFVGAAVQTQRSRPMTAMTHLSYANYVMTEDSLLLSTDEKDVIDHIHEYVPQDETLIIQPYTGSSVIYAYTGYNVTAKHVLYTATPEVETINRGLKNALTDPKVCEAVRAAKAYYYVDFGTKQVDNAFSDQYPGFIGVKRSGVLTPVYTKGKVGLYKVSAC